MQRLWHGLCRRTAGYSTRAVGDQLGPERNSSHGTITQSFIRSVCAPAMGQARTAPVTGATPGVDGGRAHSRSPCGAGLQKAPPPVPSLTGP